MAVDGKVWEDKIKGFMDDARQNMQDGGVTAGYKANREEMVAVLNRALCAEWVAFLQYKHHFFMASDIHSPEIAEEFNQHAQDELGHADRIAARIQQLGGVPVDKPVEIDAMAPIRVDYGHSLRNMMEEDLVDERAAISLYQEIVRYAGNNDAVTREMFEEILSVEWEHADDWANFLFEVDPSTNRVIPDLHQAMLGRAGATSQMPGYQASPQQPQAHQ